MPFTATCTDLEDIMLSKLSQREKENTVWYHIYYSWYSLQQTSEYNKKKQTQAYREQASAYQWGEGKLKGQYRGRGIRSTNYYV